MLYYSKYMEDNNQNNKNLSPTQNQSIPQPSQTIVNQVPQESHDSNTKTIVTVLVLLFAYPLGLIIMWLWPKWPKWIKFLVTIPLILAILGISVAMLVATKDPLKNLAKAQDAHIQNSAQELSNALFRYNDENEAFPWETPAATSSAEPCQKPQQSYVSTTFMPCVRTLIDNNQLKSGFVSTRVVIEILSKLVVNDNGKDISVCFMPSVQNTDSIYDVQGNSCTTKGSCYACVKQDY